MTAVEFNSNSSFSQININNNSLNPVDELAQQALKESQEAFGSEFTPVSKSDSYISRLNTDSILAANLPDLDAFEAAIAKAEASAPPEEPVAAEQGALAEPGALPAAETKPSAPPAEPLKIKLEFNQTAKQAGVKSLEVIQNDQSRAYKVSVRPPARDGQEQPAVEQIIIPPAYRKRLEGLQQRCQNRGIPFTIEVHSQGRKVENFRILDDDQTRAFRRLLGILHKLSEIKLKTQKKEVAPEAPKTDRKEVPPLPKDKHEPKKNQRTLTTVIPVIQSVSSDRLAEAAARKEDREHEATMQRRLDKSIAKHHEINKIEQEKQARQEEIVRNKVLDG